MDLFLRRRMLLNMITTKRYLYNLGQVADSTGEIPMSGGVIPVRTLHQFHYYTHQGDAGSSDITVNSGSYVRFYVRWNGVLVGGWEVPGSVLKKYSKVNVDAVPQNENTISTGLSFITIVDKNGADDAKYMSSYVNDSANQLTYLDLIGTATESQSRQTLSSSFNSADINENESYYIVLRVSPKPGANLTQDVYALWLS